MSEVTFEWNPRYPRFMVESAALVRDHWREVGSHRDVLKLNPSHDRYIAMQATGMLHILLARVDGKLAGYLFMLIAPHPRDQSARVAKDDLFYVAPQFRRLGLGPTMLEQAERYAAAAGVDILFLTEKLRRTLRRGKFGGQYLARRGFEPIETTWAKVLKLPHGDST